MEPLTEESVFGQSLEYSGGSDEVRESCRQRDREHSDGDHPWQGIDVLEVQRHTEQGSYRDCNECLYLKIVVVVEE